MKKLLSTVLAGAMAMALAAPVFAETYELEPNYHYAMYRDDHGDLIGASTGSGGDHEYSGFPGGSDGILQKLWPDTTYHYRLLEWMGLHVEDGDQIIALLTDSRFFDFRYKTEGGGKKILKEAKMESKEEAIKLVTGPNTSDEEFLFNLTGKFKVKDNANLEALSPIEELLGAELEHGDVIEMSLGRFVVGNRKSTASDVDREAGEYAMVWDPHDADRNTLLYETEAGTLLEVRLKADTDADMLYLKLNTAWKAMEEAGLVPEEAFPDGDAVLYSFEDTNNLLSATSRADIYIHNHPDTALGGENMTDLYEEGRLYIYSASIGEDGKASLTDISGSAGLGIVDGEKALRIRDRALMNIILSTVPFSQG